MTKAEVIKLAEYLETYGPRSNINCTSVTAATELRRLHAENEALKVQRKPLAEEQIIEWIESGEYNVRTNDWASHIDFVRAVEAAHGITGETK